MSAHRWSTHTQSVVTVLAIVLTAFAGLLAVAPRASATTYVSGFISVDTTWGIADTVYVVRNHVTVRPGVSLTILPGTTVRFDAGMGLFVQGKLAANGLANTPIMFTGNGSAIGTPWYGIQFNMTSTGSVTSSVSTGADRAFAAFDSSPTLTSNTIRSAGAGFILVRSNAVVTDNVVQRATSFGIHLNQSFAQVLRNSINNTFAGIEAEWFGSPTISNNTVTNSSGAFATGIWVQNGVGASLRDNRVIGVRGSAGPNGAIPGAAGGVGGTAFGILVTDAASATVIGNTVDTVAGGRGGNGVENPAPGGRGGNGGGGGAAGGIVIANTPTVDLEFNTVRSLSGGRGGNGGGNAATAIGGNGGPAGLAAAYYLVGASTSTFALQNFADGVTGGLGGHGAAGSATDGSGAVGGAAYGFNLWAERSPSLSGNTLQNIRGGLGGNSTALGTGRGPGQGGGDAYGIAAFGIDGVDTFFHSNIINTLRGGNGGRGQASGGTGGNATGILVFGNGGGQFNTTTATSNQILTVSGGNGGVGNRRGGNGGGAGGITMVVVLWNTAFNYLFSFQGGPGGDSLSGLGGGRGGDAAGFAAVLVPQGYSSWDTVSTVTKGAPGAGPPAQISFGNGVYLAGNHTLRTRLTVDNGTVTGTGDRDFFVDSYAWGTTIDTPFIAGKVQAQPAGNLTVRNHLGTDIFWPDGLTFVSNARIVVQDQGATVWNVVSPTGSERWLLVTDRVYIQSNVATDNRTDVTVTYGSERFASDPRSVDMATTHTERFVMVDQTAPTSRATGLPTYENTWNFPVSYIASDGPGVGLRNITLFYKRNGSGGWIPFATQPAQPFGFFSFVASADGVYEFATIADDLAGNRQPGPSANDTWTIVDTTRPGSHVNPLSTYQRSLSFLVSWAPDPGTTDIASYDIQYNSGVGWFAWISGTTNTSGTFTAPRDGTYEFRSRAVDRAGNVETLPAGNDTWTIVDTNPPFTSTQPLPVWQTSSSFLVTWTRESADVASYRIDVRDNGGPWTPWLAVPVTTTSGTFTGAQDRHTYEFRSIGTDRAGNVQTPPAGNQSWTIVDLTPPNSAVNALPPYEISLLFGVTWGPVSGTTDIVSYTLEVSDNGGAWTQVPGSIGTTATSANFVGIDGHHYAFRSLSRDRAGNVETAPSGNDTWTIVDVTRPSVITGSPQGAGTNLTPAIIVRFSEPMNRAVAEGAFRITPVIDGTFSWSADSTVMTFTPQRSLQAGTTYSILVDSSARDRAGNTMSGPFPYQFTTSAAPPGGAGAGDWIWALGILIAGALTGVFLFLFMRQRAATKAAPAVAKKPEEVGIIDDVFLLYNDGLLIKHETRRLKPNVDSDILSGMLTAVQQFVKDSFRSEEGDELNEMTFGQMHILLGRGKWLILAAIIGGDGVDLFTGQIKRCIEDMETHAWDELESWNGDMAIAKTLGPYVKKLIRGEYLKSP